jgi:hypothetical protein
VNCPPFLSLSFWVELVGACNSIWYQGQRSRARVLACVLIKIITSHSNIHVCGLGESAHEGECWSISELPTFLHKLKLLGWTGWCMQLNTSVLRSVLLWTLASHLRVNGHRWPWCSAVLGSAPEVSLLRATPSLQPVLISWNPVWGAADLR